MERETSHTKRILLLGAILVLWGGAIAARLFYLQVIEHETYRQRASRQQERTRPIPAQRGKILDREGRELAVNVASQSLVINPVRISEMPGAPSAAASILARYAGSTTDGLLERIDSHTKFGSGYLRLKKDLDDEEYARLRSLQPHYEYIELEESARRLYPKGALASQVVGVTGFVEYEIDDPKNPGEKQTITVEEGAVGIERSFDRQLRGTEGSRWTRQDVRQKVLASKEKPPQHGQDLMLTVDARVQYAAEKALAEAVKKANGDSGTAVALDPHNGQVLAIANYPTFDPNMRPRSKADLTGRLNLAISAPYEPGSVFKVFTFAAAIEKTNLTDEQIINCGSGSINLFGQRVRDHHSYASLSFADVLAKSSNVGTINIALQVGPDTLWEYLVKFGFGRRTGIELPAEDPGLLRPICRWTKRTVGYSAIGHEVMATTLQLARGMAAIANGGLLIEPRILLEPQQARPEPERIILEKTAYRLRQLLQRVVLMGTGRGAAFQGFSAAGKTGSAQIYDPKEKKYLHRYNASFVGFAPVNNPEVVIAISIHNSDKFGGSVAAPVFSAIAAEALSHEQVMPDMPAPPTLLASLMPKPMPAPEILNEAADLEESPESMDSVYAIGPRTPDFTGLSKQEVLSLSVSSGLPVQAVGHGIARSQEPRPGTLLPPGKPVEVRFAF